METTEPLTPQQKRRAYYLANRERYNERGKQYYAAHKEKALEYAKKYKQEHKERLTAYECEKLTCSCGMAYMRKHKARHERSKKHQNALA